MKEEKNSYVAKCISSFFHVRYEFNQVGALISNSTFADSINLPDNLPECQVFIIRQSNRFVFVFIILFEKFCSSSTNIIHINPIKL